MLYIAAAGLMVINFMMIEVRLINVALTPRLIAGQKVKSFQVQILSIILAEC